VVERGSGRPGGPARLRARHHAAAPAGRQRRRPAFLFYAKYLAGIRWLFHGQFSAQDHWMVAETDAPPERLYRPDISLIEWRRLVEEMAGDDRP